MLRATNDKALIVSLNDQIFPGEPLSCAMLNSAWWIWRDSEPAGFCGVRAVTLEPWTWFLVRAGLLPHARGRGRQRRMIRTRVAYARTCGAERVVTYTVHGNWRSANNLIRCGFSLYEPVTRWAGKVLYWEKDL